MKNRGIIMLFVVSLLMPAGLAFAEDDSERRGPGGPGYGEGMSGEKVRGSRDDRWGRRDKRSGRRGEEGGMPPGRWWRMSEVADQLKLTPEEKKTLDSIFRDKRRKMIDMKSQVEKEKLELEVILENRNLDEKAVMSQFRKVHDAKGEMSEARFDFIIAVRKLLGYERFQQLKTSVKKRSHRGGRNSVERQPMRQEGRMPEERR